MLKPAMRRFTSILRVLLIVIVALWIVQAAVAHATDAAPPLTTPTPASGTYHGPQSVTLACDDGAGSGCAGTWYCLGTGCTPTTSYDSAIAIDASTDLRFYSTDLAGNSEGIQTATYTITPPGDLIASGQVQGGSINSLGEVVWSQYDPVTGHNQLYSSIRGQLTSDGVEHYSVAINDLGDLAWVEYGNVNGTNTYSIKGIIGGQQATLATTQIDPYDYSIDINDRGEVVWVQYNGNYSQIFSSVRGQLTHEDVTHGEPSINNRGDVVYVQSDSQSPLQVYELETGSAVSVAVTSDASYHYSAGINDNGEIVWNEYNVSVSRHSIVSNVRGILVSNVNYVGAVDLNNCGDIVYQTAAADGQAIYRLGTNAPCVSHPDANDVQGQASAVTLGDIFTGVLDSTSNPVDWYRFDANAGDNLHLTVAYDNRPPNALTIGLYDGNGNLVSGPTGSNPLHIDSQATYTGSYYLKLESAGGRFGYTVSLSKYTTNCGVGPCPDLVASGTNLGWGVGLNSLGEVVWSQYDPVTSHNQLYSSTRGQLTSDAVDHNSPAGNDLGDLAWVEYGNVSGNWTYSVKGLIGGQAATFASSQNTINGVDLNDRGEVVWSQPDGSGVSQLHSSVRGLLTRDGVQHNGPHLNNRGDIVYTVYDPANPGPQQVNELAAGSTTPVAVTSDSLDHPGAAINDSGEIVWIERDPSGTVPGSRIVSSTRGELVPPANDIWNIDLDNCGDIVYQTAAADGQAIYRLGTNAPCVSHPDANDVQGQASAVTLGDIFTGVLDSTSNPVDWYRFDANAGDNLHLTVAYDNTPPNALTIGLYDGNGNLVSGPTGTDPLHIDSQATYTGTYYLKLESAGGRFGYTVSLSKYTTNCGVGPCPEVIGGGDWGPSGISINSLGEVIWSQFDQVTELNQLFSSLRGQLTSDNTGKNSAAINDLGDLVWVEYVYVNGINSFAVKGNIGGQLVEVATSSNGIGKVDLNDLGEVVWTQNDAMNTSQVYSNLRGQLTSGTIDHFNPSINNRGDVVFSQLDPTGQQIYKLAAGDSLPTVVTSGNTDHRSPSINDIGEIVWAESGTDSFSRLVSTVRGILVSASDISTIDLNNCGDLVYAAFVNGQPALYRLGRNAPCMAVPERLFDLAVGKDPASTGSGQVTSSPAGISLGTADTMTMAPFPADTQVTLTVTPDASSVFAGWSGACSGTGTCQVTMDLAKSVTARFDEKPADLTPPVTTATPAGGTNTGALDVTLSCSDAGGSGCAATYYCLGTGCTPTTPYVSPITIAATTDLRFYSTDLAGNDEAVATAAYTILPPDATVTLSVNGSGTGSVTSSPAGIACNTNCSAQFANDSSVTLHAAAAAYSSFTGWSGACAGMGDCVLVMTGDRSVTATFTKDTVHQVQTGTGTAAYYATIQEAYGGVGVEDTIRLWATDYTEDLFFDADKIITLVGGYDEQYLTRTGFTTLHGSLTIGRGTVIVDGLEIAP